MEDNFKIGQNKWAWRVSHSFRFIAYHYLRMGKPFLLTGPPPANSCLTAFYHLTPYFNAVATCTCARECMPMSMWMGYVYLTREHVCVFMCLCACVALACAHLFKCLRACVRAFTCVCNYVCERERGRKRESVCVYVCVRARVCECVCVCLWMGGWVCQCVWPLSANNSVTADLRAFSQCCIQLDLAARWTWQPNPPATEHFSLCWPHVCTWYFHLYVATHVNNDPTFTRSCITIRLFCFLSVTYGWLKLIKWKKYRHSFIIELGWREGRGGGGGCE